MASPTLFPDSGLNTDQIEASFFPLEPRRRDDSNGPCRVVIGQTLAALHSDMHNFEF